MASALAGMTLAPAAAVRAVSAQKPRTVALARSNNAVRRVAPSVRPARKARTALQSTASMEVAQVAVDFAEISTPAAVMVALTLIGLSLGFVLLRVESLVEEGKL